jgi:flavorubredoxin
MAVTLTPTVDWLPHCYPHEGRHEHVSVYLVRSGDDYVLVDSGSVYHRSEVEDQVETATDGQGLDALVLSHSDYPHAGNITQLGAETDDVELVASSGSPPQQGLPAARTITIGDTETIRGRTFSFIDPPLADRSHTTWIYDHGNGVLFTADGFGSYHDPDRCGDTSADFDGGVPTEAVYEHHRDNLVWLQYVDPGKLRTTLDSIFDEYDVAAIAPVHGTPVVGEDIRPFLDAFYDAAARIADEYTVES